MPFLHAAKIAQTENGSVWLGGGYTHSPVKWMKVCANASLMPTFPLFYDFLCPPPLSHLRPPLSLFLWPCDLITPLLISFDHCWLIRGQHLGGSHGNWGDQIFFTRWVEVWWVVAWGVRNALRLTALTDRAVQRPATASSMCVGVYVTSFPLSPLPIPWTQWERVEWRAVCESVYEVGGVQGYRGSYFLTAQKGSKQPQQ